MRRALTVLFGLMLATTGVAAQTSQANPAKPSIEASKAKKPVPKAKVKARASKTVAKAAPAKRQKVVRVLPARPSEGMQAGLHKTQDRLDLKSSVALVVDQDTNEILFQKNSTAVLPIASITKLMTALVTVEARLPMDEELLVSAAERIPESAHSKLQPGITVTRAQAMHMALMSSDNRAAHLLGRTYPGGPDAFVEAMNAKAKLLGMNESRFAEPTGLSIDNRSSAGDLVRLATAAYQHEVIRDYSTTAQADMQVGKRMVKFGSTNRLTSDPNWDIGLQKTGYTSAAGRCLVMQTVIEGQRVMMVLLDSVGKFSRLGDAQRIRTWLEEKKHHPVSAKTVGLDLAPRSVAASSL